MHQKLSANESAVKIGPAIPEITQNKKIIKYYLGR